MTTKPPLKARAQAFVPRQKNGWPSGVRSYMVSDQNPLTGGS
jgi:hypothetical protein